MLMKSQYGLREYCNTKVVILEFGDNAYNSVNNSECLLAVNVDLTETSNTVNHSILMRKFHHIGVRGEVFHWFKSYLTDRKQHVAVEGIFSTSKVVADSGIS